MWARYGTAPSPKERLQPLFQAASKTFPLPLSTDIIKHPHTVPIPDSQPTSFDDTRSSEQTASSVGGVARGMHLQVCLGLCRCLGHTRYARDVRGWFSGGGRCG